MAYTPAIDTNDRDIPVDRQLGIGNTMVDHELNALRSKYDELQKNFLMLQRLSNAGQYSLR